MSEEIPIQAEAEEAQHRELLNNLGILISDEELNREYQLSLEYCGGDDRKASEMTAHKVRVYDEGPRLEDAIDEGRLGAGDLHDSTGALTLAGKIAREYVNYRLDPDREDQEQDDPKLMKLFDAISAHRVEDAEDARIAARDQDPYREQQQAYEFIAKETDGWRGGAYDKDDKNRVDSRIWAEGRSILNAVQHHQTAEIFDSEPSQEMNNRHLTGLRETIRRGKNTQNQLFKAHDDTIRHAEEIADTRRQGSIKHKILEAVGAQQPVRAQPTSGDVHIAASNLAHEAGQQAEAAGEEALARRAQWTNSHQS